MRTRPLAALVLLCTAVAGVLATPVTQPEAESYRESLRVTPFPDGKVLSEFRFTLDGPWQEMDIDVSSNAVAHHHTLLPRLLTSLVRRHRVASFHLTLSSGRWLPTWPIHLPASLPASGIELTAWLELLEGESDADERRRWEAFTSTVSGLFCAGVVADGVETGTSSPTWAVPFEGKGDEAEHRLYRLTMPRLAAACTESLTPFLSLLPCASHAGLTSLLNPHRLFDGEWTLIGINFAKEEAEETAKIELEVGSVQDPVRRDRLTGQMGRREFSLHSLFDRTLSNACPVANASTIELIVPTHSISPFSIEPDRARVLQTVEGRDVAIWDVQQALESAALDVRVTWPGENVFQHPLRSKLPVPPLTVRRITHGVGVERGRIGVELVNNLDEEAQVVWGETWPWWLRTYLSTLEVTVDGNASSDLVTALDYVPSIARKRPTSLQALLRVPRRSTARLLVAYETASLWYTEYPSDANRGFAVPGAAVTLLSPVDPNGADEGASSSRGRGFFAERGRPRLRLNTPTTLISLPTPDFSMPYNVIILTSTVVALFFGSVMNGLVRKWWAVDVGPDTGEGEGEKVKGD
ncbi:GPI transamidase component PIG-T [Rhodotorula diobovata]|uniref:GPI transamidase component PIG-T n=1 Tax=Rhodotorula diobovata TaxID=5288 RepID=A0A5C5FMK9_9BASI|nr:GPI transamidase component PIG-T [Rhodotorula diobovata]